MMKPMRIRSLICALGAACLGISGAAIAGLDLPVEKLAAMAQANPVNGACELKDPQVLNRDGVPSLALNVTIGQKTFTTTISALAGQTTWSEVQGVRPTGQAYWRFILSGGDSSHPGSVTALNWDVEGNDLRTKSLSVDYVDPTSGQPDSVQCL